MEELGGRGSTGRFAARVDKYSKMSSWSDSRGWRGFLRIITASTPPHLTVMSRSSRSFCSTEGKVVNKSVNIYKIKAQLLIYVT